MEKCLVHKKIARTNSCRGNDCVLKNLIGQSELGDFHELHKVWGTTRVMKILQEEPVERRKEVFEMLIRQKRELKQGKDKLTDLVPFEDSSQNSSVSLINDRHSQDNHNGSQFLSDQPNGVQSAGGIEHAQQFLGARNVFLENPNQNPQGVQSNAFLGGVPRIENSNAVHGIQNPNTNHVDEFLAVSNGHQNANRFQSNVFLGGVPPLDKSYEFLVEENAPTNDFSLGRDNRVTCDDNFSDWFDKFGGLENVMLEFQNRSTGTGTEGSQNENFPSGRIDCPATGMEHTENKRGVDNSKHAEWSSGVAATMNGSNLTEIAIELTQNDSFACRRGARNGLQQIEGSAGVEGTWKRGNITGIGNHATQNWDIHSRGAICNGQQQIECSFGNDQLGSSSTELKSIVETLEKEVGSIEAEVKTLDGSVKALDDRVLKAQGLLFKLSRLF